MKKSIEITSVDPVFSPCEDHAHLTGLHVKFEVSEERLTSSSASVGAGSKRYEANYDHIDWN